MMQAAVVPSPADLLRSQIEAALSHRIPSALTPREKQPPLTIPTGLPAVDALTGGVPRGCLTEICGPASSGRTSLLLALLAQVTARGEVCALVDAGDAFDPASAAAAGVDLRRVLWVRCSAGAQLPAVSYQRSAKPTTETQRYRGIESLGDRVIESLKSNHAIAQSPNHPIHAAEGRWPTTEGFGRTNRKRISAAMPPALDLNAEGNNYHSWMHQVWMDDPSKLSEKDAEVAAGRWGHAAGEKSVSRFPFSVSRTTQHAAEGRRPTTEGFSGTRNQKLETPTANRKLKAENRRATPTEQALRAADLLLQSGGFGLIVVDLADVPPQTARRVPLTSWFRFRRAVEGTPTALVVLEQEPYAKTCASLVLQLARSDEQWRCVGRSLPHTTLLRDVEFTVEVSRSRTGEDVLSRKPPARASFTAAVRTTLSG